MIDMPSSPEAAASDDTLFSDTKKSSGIDTILAWLDMPQPKNPADQLLFLKIHLATLHLSEVQAFERLILLRSLCTRSVDVVQALIPEIVVTSLPVSKKKVHLVRNMQDILQSLADDLMELLPINDAGWIDEPQSVHEWALWQILHAFSLHIHLSMLIASPVAVGMWQQLHHVYEIAFLSKISKNTPKNVLSSLRDVYYATILMGCIQPPSFNSEEINFISSYFRLFSDQVYVTTLDNINNAPSIFWINPQCDAPAFACNRKQPLLRSNAHYFSCFLLVNLMQKHMKLLESGYSPDKIGLPDFASTSAGINVLRRLVNYLGSPGQRRFPRRNQKYRIMLCTQIDTLWRLFQHGEEASVEPSLWMVINESPDGLSIMHISGETGDIALGDIAAICPENGGHWQICIVRWAISENQEDLEIGLQILATQAAPASIPRYGEDGKGTSLSVLVLPSIPNLRSNELLVVPAGSLKKCPDELILMVEKENLEIREVRRAALDEQNNRIEIYSIAPQEVSTTLPEEEEQAVFT
ncbi:MAG: hypothetical protein LBD67_05860 [Candidatus Accumulibacter sp.]|jgi:hypothetical protein|nr:hypothetical protein [Accumulibacter sp.]